jgi:hypothetical protein
VNKHALILCLLGFAIGSNIYSQEPSSKNDSTTIYENIESYSRQSKFTRFLYGLIFKNPADSIEEKYAYKKLIKKPYHRYEGKIIRHLNVEALDPFGYSINSTEVAPLNYFGRTGNKLHAQTRGSTIRNLVLMRENEPFDSLFVMESERLIRRNDYIRDVVFHFEPVAGQSDSVDVFIRVLDRWSIIPKIKTNSSYTHVGVKDQNFAGLGHVFESSYTRHRNDDTPGFYLNYHVPNFRNTYINLTGTYGTNESKYYVRGIQVDRPFFSPYAKWAAGINVEHQYFKAGYLDRDSDVVLQNVRFNTVDLWGGNAIRLFGGNTEYTRSTNFISALRMLRIRFIDKPLAAYDTLRVFDSENFVLGTLGVSTRTYVQDTYVFQFGITEDIPIGKVFSITAGYQEKSNVGRFYLSGRASYGTYRTWGYLSPSIEYGTFFEDSQPKQGVLSASINYFTGLNNVGKWKFRQFVKPQVTLGINRRYNDYLSLNDGYGLDGFNSMTLLGTRRIMLTLQTQFYAPWEYIGFRIGPYFTYSGGVIGNINPELGSRKLYSLFGIGVLIKNENLVLNMFELSLTYYPVIPDFGYDVFKFNSSKTSDFGFRDFEIGKPSPVSYK